ncbi:MAG: M28 family metallopeptidase, partial [Chloroflexota bacterium]
RRLLLAFLWLVSLNAACAILGEPQRPDIPTPPPTAPPVSFTINSAELVTDPVGSITPQADPDIEALVNAVSQQQLLAYVQTLEGFGTRHTLSETQRDDWGIGAARRWLHSEFERVGGGRLEVTYDDFPVFFNGLETNQQNVIATLPGVGPHAGVFMMMAHYDSRTIDAADGGNRAPGANDNASGVAAVLEAARLLSSRTWNQTIIFAAWAAEEQGTFGSRHFVQDRLLSGAVIDAALNNDIVGGRLGLPQAVRLFSPGPDTSPSRQLARYMNLITGLYVPTFALQLEDALDREGRYSDHREFVNAGVAGMRITEVQEDPNRQHNAQDTAEAIDYNYLAQVVRLNVATLANLAGAPPPPPVPTVAPMANPGSFIVSWSPDPLAAGYAISFRPVGSADYAPFYYVNALDAGNVALTNLDPNVAYAVSLAALDTSGRISAFSSETIIQSP